MRSPAFRIHASIILASVAALPVQTNGSSAGAIGLFEPYRQTTFRAVSSGFPGFALQDADNSAPAVPAKSEAREEYRRLEEEMLVAEEAYAEALDMAWEEKARAKNDGKPPKPKDDRLPVLKKMDALVKAVSQTPDAAFVAGQTLLWAIGIDSAGLLPRMEEMVSRHPDDSALTDAVVDISHVVVTGPSSEIDRWIKTLDSLATRTNLKETRVGARFALAQVFLHVGRLPQSRALFEEVRSASPDSDFAREARGYVHEIDHLQVGMKAPEFTVKTLAGQEISLNSLRGKAVLLNFWASWCPHCLSLIPTFKEIVAKTSGTPFEILSISVDEERIMLENTLEKYNPPGMQAWEPKASENPPSEIYNVHGLPSWYLLDGQGVIRAKNFPPDQLTALLESILKPGSETTPP